MRDINRLDIFYNEMKECHKKLLDWRFGQLLMNFTSWYYQKYKQDFFYVEDNRLINSFKEFVNEMIGGK